MSNELTGIPEEDDFDPEAAERSIREFIDSAEALPGPALGELADLVGDVMRESWDRIQGLMSGQRHNKVLATQLLFSQPESRRLMTRNSGGSTPPRRCSAG